jgi:competence protein ComEA
VNLPKFFKTYRVPLMLGGFSLLCIIISLVLLVKTSQSVTPIQFSRVDEASGSALGEQASIAVDIEGAVAKPGIITLSEGSRVEDAMNAAGGLTSNADETYVAQHINRAMKVVDGMKVYVPKAGEDMTSHNIDSLVATSQTPSQNATFISINLASKDALDSLPGVGPVTAQKIIDNRPYQTLDDLVTKKAIGPSLFAKLKNTLSL